MQKNVASQKIGAQMVSASDGSAFTGSVTVSVTGDAGTQATGSVGSGACTHEGNGYHTYAPAQAETNYDLIAFTFIGTGAVPATIQIFTRVNTNVIAMAADVVTSSAMADGAITTETFAGGAIQATVIQDGAFTAAKFGASAITSTVLADNAITAAKINADAITAAKIADGAIDAATFASGAINAAAIANGAIDAATFAADVDAEILSYIVDDATRIDASALNTAAVTTVPAILDDTDDIGVAGAGLTAVPWNASWDAEVQSECADALNAEDGANFTAIPWNAAWDAEVQSEATDALNAYDPPTKAELDTAVANVSVDEIQASALADLFNTDSGTTYASAVAGSPVAEIADNAGGASLTVQDIVDGVWDEPLADHQDADTTGEALGDAGGAGASVADIADAVWDESTAGHTTSGTFGEQLKTDVDAILVDTGTTLEDRQALIKTAVDAILVDTGTTLEDRQVLIKTAVDAILVDTGTTLDDLLENIETDSDTMQGNILSILALLDNARSEPGQGSPPVNPDAMTKLDYLYKAWRNKKDNDGTQNRLYADDSSTVDTVQSTTVSGSTVTKGRWGAP